MSSTVADNLLNEGDDLRAAGRQASGLATSIVEALASLKLTCVLLLLSMILVFVGSLAQAQEDVWPVVRQYFRTWVADIELAHLFPPSMFPEISKYDWESLGALQTIPFPGGWTIGMVMFVNLLAAHLLRFKMRARGGKLLAGLGVTSVGAAMTWLIISIGNNQKGVESANTLLTPIQIWYVLLGLFGVAAVIPIASSFMGNRSRPERIVLWCIGGAVGALFLYFVIGGENARLNLSSMRILWQLLKGSACSMVLLIGCQLLFDKRAGIVLLHVGVAMLMISELLVAINAEENMLTLQEGETGKFLRDVRERELAIIIPQEDGNDQVVTVPEARLQNAADATADEDRLISLPSEKIPFDLRVHKFYRNSQLRSVLPGDEVAATTGLGTFAYPMKLDPLTGMDDGQDMSTVAVELVDRDSGKSFESILVAQDVSETRKVPIAERAVVDGENYDFYMRFERNYRPYEVTLVDTSRTDYVGTNKPRDYRSTIRIRNTENDKSEEFTVWMNNPLRYEGETFYQTGHQELGDTEISTISVVRNTGWMLPYIACMIVGFGMFAQFWASLSRYLGKLDRSAARTSQDASPSDSADLKEHNPFETPSPGKEPKPVLHSKIDDKAHSGVKAFAIPVVVTVFCLLWVVKDIRIPSAEDGEFNFVGFNAIPVAWSGRPQPVDSFARAELLMTSHKSTFTGELDQQEIDEDRKEILEDVKEFWPNLDTSSLEDFSGEYSDWIEKIVELTASGEEAVEVRMRDTLTQTRVPATRWFLDMAARPELSDRHRIIKIDNDQVLSALKLEKRPGMSYSLLEVSENLQELNSTHMAARRLQMAQQEQKFTPIQQGTIKLFDSIRRVNNIRDLFLLEESDGLIESITRAWWILDQVGQSNGILAVPTEAESERRSWESFTVANAMQNVAAEMKQRDITNRDELMDYVDNKLARELMSNVVAGTYEILKQLALQEASPGEDPEPDAINKLAADRAGLMPDAFLQSVMQMIGRAEPGLTAEEILDALEEEELQELAAERVTSNLFQVFEALNEKEDERLNDIRRALQQAVSENPDSAAKQMQLMNGELLKVAMDDLEARASDVIYSNQPDSYAVSTTAWRGILNAWRDQDVAGFNQAVADYHATLNESPVSGLDNSRIRTEAWFNEYQPFWKAINLYIIVMVASFFGWLFWGTTLRRTGFWLMLLAFAVHTAALIIRIYISGRPPVTSLYSSAIFIGWAVVAAAFVVEKLVGLGIGNLLGAASGASTLVIAHYLAIEEGDTMGVMQAVLDTTFWLATHVVCITLGYAATFLAGLLGLSYVIVSVGEQNNLNEYTKQKLSTLGKMVYGVLCFAIFFSLVGTVLGGLWADDSWGRFWGWDPKENGAMLIVLWNAVILHARWDKMIRDYGTAVLAMVGNVVTAWSWFGVNELGAGLHSYGFTSGRLLALIVFVAIQMIIVVAATFLGMAQRNRAKADAMKAAT